MLTEAINVLEGQRRALEAAPVERRRVYEEQVIKHLLPLWERTRSFMPPGPDGQAPDPITSMNLYPPDFSAEEGLTAIATLTGHRAWESCRETLDRSIAALRPDQHGVVIDGVRLTLCLGNPQTLAGMNGYTGVGQAGNVLVLVWPDEYNIPRLAAIVAHEFHHIVRLTLEPWSAQTSVGQYVVLEGMAEAFAAEICGEEKLGPWVRVLSDEQIAELKPFYKQALHVTGFNEIRGYVFGDNGATAYGYKAQGIPMFAGYAMGYRIVKAYLKRTGKTAAEATYVPWAEVVEQSGFFD